MRTYSIDKRSVRRSFDRAARTYDDFAILQKAVHEQLLRRLDLIKIAPESILDAGCGTGQATRTLMMRYRPHHMIALDIAEGMLGCVRRASASWQFWRQAPSLLCADLEHLPLCSDSMDLIWSSLSLQWCGDLARTFAQVHRVLRAPGLFLFSTFGANTLYELRVAGGTVQHFVDIHELGDLMVSAGFAEIVLDVERFVLTYDEVLALLAEVKAIGAHSARSDRPKGLSGKENWKRMLLAYEQFRDAEGKIPASYEVVYAHGWKLVPPTQAVQPIVVHRR